MTEAVLLRKTLRDVDIHHRGVSDDLRERLERPAALQGGGKQEPGVEASREREMQIAVRQRPDHLCQGFGKA